MREDNADRRLSPIARELGLLNDAQWAQFEQKVAAIDRETARLKTIGIHPNTPAGDALISALGKPLDRDYKAHDLLRRPELTHEILMNALKAGAKLEHEATVVAEAAEEIENRVSDPGEAAILSESILAAYHEEPILSESILAAYHEPIPKAVAEQVEIDIKYAGYVDRQNKEIERTARYEGSAIPKSFCYRGLPGLSTEVVEKLERVRPETVGQAANIPGVTKAAVTLLLIYLKKKPERHEAQA